MSVIFDEFGRPFVILREQQKKKRIKGIQAHKSNILAALSVSNVLRTSLGPKGELFLSSQEKNDFSLLKTTQFPFFLLSFFFQFLFLYHKKK